MEEKRRDLRLSFKEPIGFRIVAGHKFGGCLSYDLSEGGVRFRFNDFVPLGKEMSFTIPLASERVLEVRGKVVWVNKERFEDAYSVGVKFLLDNEDIQAKADLNSFVTSSQPSDSEEF